MKGSVAFQLLLIVMLPFYGHALDTAQYPEIGKPCPEFTLNDIQYYHKSQASLADFRGRWLILDFWGEYCSGCIASFPKMNDLKEKFGDKIEIVLIGLPRDNSATIRNLYEKCRKAKKLELPIVFDKNLGLKFYTHGLPLIIVIDPQGIVKAITYKLTANDIQDLTVGKNPSLPRNYLLNEDPAGNYNYDLPLLINNNGSTEMDFLYRSVLAKAKETMPHYSIMLSRGRFEALGVDLKTLFKLAYIGKTDWSIDDTILYGNFSADPILEIKDSSLFEIDKSTNKNIFSYSTCFPDQLTPEENINPYDIWQNKHVQRIIQKDLENYFGLVAIVERRKALCYRLRANEKAKQMLRTKGGQPSASEPNGPKQGRLLTNLPVSTIIGSIYGSIGCPINGIPILDETEIEGNIDIRIDAIYYEDCLKELRKNGLTMVPEEKEINTLVIQEKKD